VQIFNLLRQWTEHKATTSYSAIAALAEKHTNFNGSSNSYRQQFVELVKKVSKLDPAGKAGE
jgi:hypothetical protein